MLFVLHLLLPLGLRSLCLSVQLGQLLLLDEQLLVNNPLLGLPLQVPLYSRVELGSVLNLNIVNTQITNCKLLLTLSINSHISSVHIMRQLSKLIII